MGDYKLREYAQLKSLTYRTLWNKFKEGKKRAFQICKWKIH